jgi:hypothetical protein
VVGVQDAMIDLVDWPDLVPRVMERLTEAYLIGLDQYENLHLLALNNNN